MSTSQTSRSRRAALAAGLTTIAGTAAASSSGRAGAAAVAPETWSPKKVAFKRRDRTSANPRISSCIRSGPLVFVAGIGGWYPEDRAEPGDIKVQIRSALAAMKDLLEQAGSSMANVLKVHMTVAEPDQNLAALNEAYDGHFPSPPPVRSYGGCTVDQMGRKGVLVQIDCIAFADREPTGSPVGSA